MLTIPILTLPLSCSTLTFQNWDRIVIVVYIRDSFLRYKKLSWQFLPVYSIFILLATSAQPTCLRAIFNTHSPTNLLCCSVRIRASAQRQRRRSSMLTIELFLFQIFEQLNTHFCSLIFQTAHVPYGSRFCPLPRPLPQEIGLLSLLECWKTNNINKFNKEQKIRTKFQNAEFVLYGIIFLWKNLLLLLFLADYIHIWYWTLEQLNVLQTQRVEYGAVHWATASKCNRKYPAETYQSMYFMALSCGRVWATSCMDGHLVRICATSAQMKRELNGIIPSLIRRYWSI